MKSNRSVLRRHFGVICLIVFTLILLMGCSADTNDSEIENAETGNDVVAYGETGNEDAVGGERVFTVAIRNETNDVVGLNIESDLEEDWNDYSHFIDLEDFSSSPGEEEGTKYSEAYDKTYIDSIDTGNGFKATLYLIAGTNNDGTYWEAPFVIEKVEVVGNWGDRIVYGFDGIAFTKLDD